MIEWPYGRTIRTSYKFLRLEPRYYAPLKWESLQIDDMKREQYHKALSVHADLVVDPAADLILIALRTDSGQIASRYSFPHIMIVIVMVVCIGFIVGPYVSVIGGSASVLRSGVSLYRLLPL